MISSLANPQVKQIKLLLTKKRAREEQGIFVCEGSKMFEEAKNREILLKSYFSESFYLRNENWIQEELSNGLYEILKDSLFSELTQTVTPQGVMALVRMPSYSLESLMEKRCCLLVLEDIQDPGNLGTMIRTAEAAGMSGVLMSKGTVDLFNPKVVRSTMGSIYRMPYLYAEHLDEVLHSLQASGIRFMASHLKAEKNYREVEQKENIGILIGNESNGLSDMLTELADFKVKIPMAGEAESLNAAVAAALMMYEVSNICSN